MKPKSKLFGMIKQTIQAMEDLDPSYYEYEEKYNDLMEKAIALMVAIPKAPEKLDKTYNVSDFAASKWRGPVVS